VPKTRNQLNGKTQLAYRKIWSDEKIERKAKEDGEAMGIAIGTNLLKNKSITTGQEAYQNRRLRNRPGQVLGKNLLQGC